MDDLIWQEKAQAKNGVLVLAFRGLFDIGEAATAATRHLVDTAEEAAPLAEIDPERYFNFSQIRPTVAIGADDKRVLSWPENKAYSIVGIGGERMTILSGIEPHLRWRSFCGHLIELARRTEAELVVTLGATASLTPHTRPLGVVGSSADRSLGKRLGLQAPSYEGPTGLVGVLHSELEASDVPTISLRVGVPHYVPAPPNPLATRSLLARLELVTGIATGHEQLRDEAAGWTARVDAAVADDAEMSDYISELERQLDETADEVLPSGDDLAAELESFLRSRRPEDGPNER